MKRRTPCIYYGVSLFKFQKKFELLQPIGQLVLSEEVINDKTNPACNKQYDDGQQLLYSVNGQFPNLKTCLDGEDKTYNPN